MAEARLRLTEAQQRTSDPVALARIAEYMAKLDKLDR